MGAVVGVFQMVFYRVDEVSLTDVEFEIEKGDSTQISSTFLNTMVIILIICGYIRIFKNLIYT